MTEDLQMIYTEFKSANQKSLDHLESELQKVSVFYCPGGFNYEKMSTPSKLVMKMFIKALKAKKNKTEVEQEMIKMISTSYDISDQKYIEPILECLKKYSAN